MSRGGSHVQLGAMRGKASWAAELESSLHVGEVVSRLARDESLNSVAGWLHSVGMFKGHSVNATSKALNRWWGARAEVVAVTEPHVIQDLAALEALAVLQQKRIDIIVKVETDAGMLMPTTRQEVTEQRMLLHLIIEKKQSLGLLAKRADAPTSVTQINNNHSQVVHIADGSLAARVAAVSSNPESRRRVLGAIEAMTSEKGDEQAAFTRRFQVGDRTVSLERATDAAHAG